MKGFSGSTEQAGLGTCSAKFCFVTCPLFLGRSPDTEPSETRLTDPASLEGPDLLGKFHFFCYCQCCVSGARPDIVGWMFIL